MFLQNLKIKQKLYLGFGVVLSMLLVLSFVVYTNFSNYRDIARDNVLLGRVQANILESRIAAQDFIRTGSTASIDAFNKRMTNVTEFVEKAHKDINNPERQKKLTEIDTSVTIYKGGFESIQNFYKNRNTLVLEKLNPIGLEMRENITDLMESAFRDNDPQAAFYAGSLQEKLLLGRLYVVKYLDDNNLETLERANLELKDHFNESMLLLDRNLNNPNRRALMEKTKKQMEVYLSSVEELHKIIDTRNNFMATTFLPAGSKIGTDAEWIKLDIMEEQDALGPFVDMLIIVISIIAVLISVIFAILITAAIVKPVNIAVNLATNISAGKFDANIEISGKDEIAVLLRSMKEMVETIRAMVKETISLSDSAVKGQLDKRANPNDYKGEYHTLITGLNNTLDAVIGPLNVTAEYVDRISKGDIPPKIEEEYKGDFNEIKNNLNGTIDVMTGLLKETNMLIKSTKNGHLDVRAESQKFVGDWGNLVQGINELVDAMVAPLNVTAEYVDRISKGDIPPKIEEEYKGDFNEIKNNLNGTIDVMSGLLQETNMLIRATKNGQLDVRAESQKFVGDWGSLVQGINELVDAMVAPLNVTAEYVDRISKGDIPPKIEDEYKGDFNEIKNNLNGTIDVMSGLLAETNELITAAKNGHLDVRANSQKFVGDWGSLVLGINQVVDAMVAPLNVTAEYVDRISKGDIPPVITDTYHGDFNEIKHNINQLIMNLNDYINDMNYMSNQHDLGEIDVVMDVNKFQGAYNEMALGVNNMVNGHINVKKMAMGIAKEYGNGNFDKVCPDLPGKKVFIKEILDDLRSNLINFNQEIKLLTKAAKNGDLKARGNSSKFDGGWAELVEGINDLMQAVVDPVEEATQVLKVMATGDLTGKMTGNYKGDHQVLKDNVNKVTESLNALLFQVQDTVKITANSSEEITHTSESLAAATQEQSAQSDEVASAVEEMSRTVTENAMSAGRTAEVAQKNGDIAKEGGQVVKQTIIKMRDIATVVKKSAENIEKLGESSKQIGEIISVIDDIADQTNLLALNAAIEAARAGEQGRGFAVVADEVRKLAERTTEATKQIASMIKGIQEETTEAVKAMNKGNQEVTSGIDLADKAGESLEEILSSTTEVMDMVNQIAAASEEQSATSEQISKNVQSISKVTSESASRIENVARSAEELSRLTNDLFSLMKRFKISAMNTGQNLLKSDIDDLNYDSNDFSFAEKSENGKHLMPNNGDSIFDL